jgi:hypothetical protein
MRIVVLKLITGEEVIAKQSDEKCQDGHIFIKPRTFQIVQDQTGNVRAGLIPWIMSDPDAEVLIKDSAIIAMIDATKQIEDSYLQQTSSLDLSGKL